MGLRIERWWPLVAGFAAALVVAYVPGSRPASDKLGELFAAVLTASSIAVGFLATAKAVLLTAPPEVTRFERMRRAGYAGHVIRYLFEATKANLVVALFSVACLYISVDLTKAWHTWVFAGWMGASTWAAGASYRVLTLFSTLIRDE